MKMEWAGKYSDSRSDQHLFKCYPLQNAPLLLLNQTRDIMRYGPLAPYMSLEKEKFNADVPFFNIETCRLPDWSYNNLFSHQKSTFCSPAVPVMSELQKNNQYCQPFYFSGSNFLPVGPTRMDEKIIYTFLKGTLINSLSKWCKLSSTQI